MELLQQGIAKGYVRLDAEEKRITYVYANKTYRYTDPEEKVRAEVYLQLILEYGYSPARINVELIVPRRTPSDVADIVVFEDDAQKKPYIVVECKKPTVSEAEFVQAIEQGFGNAVSLGAEYVWIASGIKSKYYKVDKAAPLERVTNLIAVIPRFGKIKASRAKFYKGAKDEEGNTAFDIEVVSQDKLTRAFTQAHQALWAGGKRNPSEAFDELDKLIFCKLWDEKKVRKAGEPYDFQEYTGEDSEFLLKRIKAIYEQGRLKDEKVFSEPIRLSKEELKTIVGYLAEINIGGTDLDSKGRAFETFLGSFFRGDFGQYFTPREVVDFIVSVLPIKNDSLVMDTSCGSGGFLLYALDKVRRQADAKAEDGYFKKDSVQHWNFWHDFAEKNLYGIEISEGIARTAKMNMIIHDDGHTNVVSIDGLQPPQIIREQTGNKGFKENRFDFIITNPPFGSSIKQTEQAYLKNYGLGIKDISWIDRKQKGKNELSTRDSQSTEVLFIEQCHRFLKGGTGILAIVVPDGVLTNSSSQYVRDWIEEHYRIISIVSLPQDAFKANDAGVKSSVMFLQKLTDAQSEKIKAAKQKLQDRLWAKPQYSAELVKLEKERTTIIKQHKGFDYAIINWESEENLAALRDIDAALTAKAISIAKGERLLDAKAAKVIEKTEEWKAWKADVMANYTEQIAELKESLQDEYLAALSDEVTDYPIFMAITENIGYDAAGRKTGLNELQAAVGPELKRFIEEIRQGHGAFFA